MISISDARITFIMGECFTAHLTDDTFDFPVLWDEWMYAYLYNQLRGGAHGPYALPWRDSQKSAFWRHYLGDSPGSVPPEQAWKKFVPLRLIFDASDIGTDLGERVLIDAFGFPFGVVSCPLLSGPSTMTVWTREGTKNACEEAQAGGDHRQAA
ncbi:MAG: hypothetical protein ACK4TC_18745 [Sphingomonas pseudosanguinis]|uniref:hypothetical protein n=1 Tax=Sphingomonas pseudosanguinis TaxID=413712 RepID=UPI00391B8A49